MGGNHQRISPYPVRARKDASPGKENEPGNVIGRSATNIAGRCGSMVHPRAKLPDRVVLWVSRLLRSSHPPRYEGRCSGEESLSGRVPRRQPCPRRCKQYTPVHRRVSPPCSPPPPPHQTPPARAITLLPVNK